MEHFFGEEWEILPAGGATGEAFYAQSDQQRLFLKRNSSPFLAVLSAEGIVPKLVWTRRLENGDVITAQQWMNGNELKAVDMNNSRVAKLLKKIHSSKPLLAMLTRLGKAPLQPEALLKSIEAELDAELHEHTLIASSLQFLREHADAVTHEEATVCHCDVNHNNWLLTDDNQLYLIDWDGAMIADPAIDLGMLLYRYIPKEEWPEWINKYGSDMTENLQMRMKWYVIIQTLSFIQWHKAKQRYQEMETWLDFLGEMMIQDN